MDIQTYDMVGKLINPIVENLEDALSDQGLSGGTQPGTRRHAETVAVGAGGG